MKTSQRKFSSSGLEDELASYDQGILLLPGTHSKHLTFQNDLFINMPITSITWVIA